MARYQVPKKAGYKNPILEGPNSATKRPTSPVQRGGLMDTAARARALRPGIPPIPALQPLEGDEPAMRPQPTVERAPAAAPINIQVGVPQAAPRAEAAKAIAREEVTGGIPEGGTVGLPAKETTEQPVYLKKPEEEEEGVLPTEEAVKETEGYELQKSAALEKAKAAGESRELAIALLQLDYKDGELLTDEHKELLAKDGCFGEEEVAEPGPTTEMRETLEPWLYDLMASEIGIPEEEIAGQIEQLKMASSDELAKFAQQMASRGMGASGLVGAGMGQIQSSTLAAMANVRFEAAKVAVEDRLNRLKSYLAFYGNMLSDEARNDLQQQINDLANDQFDYQKQQDRIADSWMQLANWAASVGAKAYDVGALSKIWDMLHTINPATGEYYTWEEVQKELSTTAKVENGVSVTYITWGNAPEAEAGAAPKGKVSYVWDPSKQKWVEK